MASLSLKLTTAHNTFSFLKSCPYFEYMKNYRNGYGYLFVKMYGYGYG